MMDEDASELCIRAMDAGGRGGQLARLVDRFAERAPAKATEIRACQNDGDAEGLRRAAHDLKSSGAAVGLSIDSRIGEGTVVTVRIPDILRPPSEE